MSELSTRWRRWFQTDVLLCVLAMVAGIGGATLAGRYLAQRAAAAEADLARRFAGREVVVASTDVRRGEELGSANLALRSVPAEYLPADAVGAAEAGVLVGGRAAIDIARGTPLVPAVLADDAGAPRLAAALAADERALTIAVDELNSQAGALRTGDRVDLYFSRREGGDALLVPLLQQVEILGTGESFAAPEGAAWAGQFTTITLRIHATEAPRVLLAQQAGELTLLLRAPGDNALQPAAIRRSSELLRQPVARRATRDIELLVGGEGGLTPRRHTISIGRSRTGDAS